MGNFDSIDKERISSKIKKKFGVHAKVFLSGSPDINYVKIFKKGKYFMADPNCDLVLSNGYDEILLADEVPANTFYSDKEKINDHVYTNQFSSDHMESNKDLIIVKRNNKYGMFHTDGQEVLPVQYEKIIWISKDRIIICREGKCGLSDTKGTCLIPCIYDKIRPVPFVKQYGYDYGEEFRQYAEEIKLITAQNEGEDGCLETGFNMNGEMVIRPCLSISPGEYFSLIDTWSEFPYTCAEVYMNLILELFPRRYNFLDLKSIGIDYAQYMEEHEECIEYICGKIVDEDAAGLT